MPVHTLLIPEAETFVTRLFHNKIDGKHAFHNIEHTRNVVAAVRELGQHYNLPGEDMLALELAAWFHDTGYSVEPATAHEVESVQLAREFLSARQGGEELMEKVEGCILATRMPQDPHNLLQQIICDADLFHLGTSHFSEKSRQLRKEIERLSEQPVAKKEWRKSNIEFLKKHTYFTDYARLMLDAGKKQNLKRLEEKDTEANASATPGAEAHAKATPGAKANATATPGADLHATASPDSEAKAKSGKNTTGRNERSITTMFRIMSNNHNDLSSMADSKAHIMISVNSIIISILISVLLGRLAYYRNLIAPTMILIITCVSAIVFAVLATRPKVSTGTFTEDDIRQKKVNLLFFGNFYNMKLEDYNWAMNEMMNDRNYLYDNMIKDIYHLGVILARKYKYLRISYNIFMFGLVISVLAFGIAMFFPSNTGSIP